MTALKEQDHGLLYFTLLSKNKHISEIFKSTEEINLKLLKMEKKGDRFQGIRNEKIDLVRLLIFSPEPLEVSCKS